MALEKTVDPNVFIEEQRDEYVRYVMVQDDKVVRRWEVHGKCRYLGDCIIGAIVRGPQGQQVMIESHEHIERLKQEWGTKRLGSAMDTPITPEFDTCCVAAGYMRCEELSV